MTGSSGFIAAHGCPSFSFPVSAWERNAWHAPPALSALGSATLCSSEAEPRRQCVPRRSLGTRVDSIYLFLIVVATLPFCPVTSAHAHALGAECKLRGDHLEIEAFYSDDTPARHARVRILQADDAPPVFEGRTDEDGCWKCDKPKPGTYQVIVEAGLGHRAKLKVVVPDRQGETWAAQDELPLDETKAGTEHAVKISEGLTRQEFTELSWLKIAIGVVAIAGFSFALWAARRQQRAPNEV